MTARFTTAGGNTTITIEKTAKSIKAQDAARLAEDATKHDLP